MRRTLRLHSWDVFAYEPLSNRLRPSDLSLGRLSSGQRQPIMRRTSHLHSWDVFAYEPLSNRLRPSDLPLGRLSSGQRRCVKMGAAFIRSSLTYRTHTQKPAPSLSQKAPRWGGLLLGSADKFTSPAEFPRQARRFETRDAANHSRGRHSFHETPRAPATCGALVP